MDSYYDSYNDVYYKIYQMRNGLLTVACVQWFDEYDYDQERFFTDDLDNQLQFKTEREADIWLNNNIKPELIDPEHRRITKMTKRDYFI